MAEIEFFVLDVDYVTEKDKPVIRLWGTQNGKVVLVLDRTFEPYFYIELRENLNKAEQERIKKRILEFDVEGRKPKSAELVERNLFSEPRKLFRVTVDLPADVPKFRDVIKNWDGVRDEYEYTMTFHKRYLIDRNIVPMSWVKVKGKPAETELSVDGCFEAEAIENLDKNTYPKFRTLAFDTETVREEGEDRIIMVSLEDSEGFSKVLTYKNVKGANRCVEVVENERRLLERFIDVVKERDPYIIVGYNTDGFDFPKLQERCENFGITLSLGRDDERVSFRRRGRTFTRTSSASLKGRVHIDLFSFVNNILSQSLTSEIFTLDKVAKEILGVGKKDLDWKKIRTSWKEESGLKELINYCIHDSKLTLLLADHLLPQIYELARMIGLTIFDASRMTYSQLVEWVLMKHAFALGEIIPNRPRYDEITRRREAAPYTGAYVHMPKEGIHENIALFDFRSLYPSIIVSHNVSPETLDCKCCRNNQVPGSEHWFCTKKRGFIPGTLLEIIKKRIDINKKINGKCDMFSSECRRLDNQQFALKILANAFYGYFGYAGSRWYSRVCATSITAWGRYYIQEVIRKAQDMGVEVIYGDTDSLFLKMMGKKDKDRFLAEVNRKLPGIMELEFKGTYKRGIFIEAKTGLAAKKKYALLDQNDRLVMRGMETRRRDWSGIAKETQEKVVLAVLRDNSPRKAVELVRKTIRNLRTGGVDFGSLIIYTQLTKPLKDYEQIGPHVAVAKKMLIEGKSVNVGDTIEYIVTKGSGSISERSEPAESAKDYDPDYYISHQVIPPALRILSGLGVKEEDLSESGGQASLTKFIRKSRK